MKDIRLMKKYMLLSLCVLHSIQLSAPEDKINLQSRQDWSPFKEIIVGTMTITGLCTALVEVSNPSGILIGALGSGAWAGLWGGKKWPYARWS